MVCFFIAQNKKLLRRQNIDVFLYWLESRKHGRRFIYYAKEIAKWDKKLPKAQLELAMGKSGAEKFAEKTKDLDKLQGAKKEAALVAAGKEVRALLPGFKGVGVVEVRNMPQLLPSPVIDTEVLSEIEIEVAKIPPEFNEEGQPTNSYLK